MEVKCLLVSLIVGILKKILQYCGRLSLVGVFLFRVARKELLRLVESESHCSGLVLEH